MTNQDFKKGEIVIYKSKEGPKLEVRLEEETVWLTQKQIAILFDTQRPAITKHLNNIFKSGELDKDSVSSVLEHTAADGKVYKTQFYNLDAIISVGYRISSKRATQFRIWATKTLKEHLIKGYTVNETRLLEAREKFKELRTTITFLQEKSQKELLSGQTNEILNLLSSYAKTLNLLEEYDKRKIKIFKGKKAKFILNYERCQQIIKEIKKELIAKKEASELFGQEVSGGFERVIKGIYQTFGRKELYPTIEDKASHLLYFTIKDHPFTDGNKRIASFLFVYFLDKNNYLYCPTREKKINDNALTALSLLIAISDPKEKDILIKIITNLLSDNYTL